MQTKQIFSYPIHINVSNVINALFCGVLTSGVNSCMECVYQSEHHSTTAITVHQYNLTQHIQQSHNIIRQALISEHNGQD